jgi:hypothetical protein
MIYFEDFFLIVFTIQIFSIQFCFSSRNGALELYTIYIIYILYI